MMISGALKMRRPALAGTHNKHELWMWSAQDFDVAARRGKWYWFLDKIARKPNKMASLHDIAATRHVKHRSDLGIQVVAINAIVGSVGRSGDFDRRFLPRRTHTRQRWISIDRAHYLGVPLPPVELIEVNERYFVSDGHHRISVARSHGQAYVEAHIVQLQLSDRDPETSTR